MNNGDTLNLSWTKVKYCHHKRPMLSIFSSRQPTDPDNLAEHWGPTPDSHRLADTTQAGCLNTDDMPTFEPPTYLYNVHKMHKGMPQLTGDRVCRVKRSLCCADATRPRP